MIDLDRMEPGRARTFGPGSVIVLGPLGWFKVWKTQSGVIAGHIHDAVVKNTGEAMSPEHKAMVDRVWLEHWDDNGDIIVPRGTR